MPLKRVYSFFISNIFQPLPWVIFLILSVPMCSLMAVNAHMLSKQITDKVIQEKNAKADLTAQSLEEKFERLMDLAASLSLRVSFRKKIEEGDWDGAADILESIPRRFDYILRIFLANKDGVLMSDTPKRPGAYGVDFSYRDWYRGVIAKNAPHVSEIYERKSLPAYNIIAVSVPIMSNDQNMLGILVIQIRLDTLESWSINDYFREGEYVYFADPKLSLAAHPKSGITGDIISQQKSNKIFKSYTGADYIYSLIDSESGDLLRVEKILKNTGWRIILEEPYDQVFSERSSMMKTILVTTGILLILLYFLAFLTCALVRNYHHAQDLERFRMIVEYVPNAIIMVDVSGVIVLINKAAEELFGYSRNEILHKKIEKLIPDRFIPDHPGLRRKYMTDPKPKMMGEGRDLFAKHKNGSEIPVEIGLSPMKTKSGFYVISTITDVSKRKAAEMQYKKYNQKLQDSNRELSDFAHVASHDMREPLRKIQSFGDLLYPYVRQIGNEKANDYLSRMQKAAERMFNLIESLLEFSSLDTHKDEKSCVDIRELIDEIKSDLEMQISESHAEIVVEPGIPPLYAPGTRIRQLFQNLISNAIKFRKPESSPKIHIYSNNTQDGFVEICVADNGIGFDEKYRDKIMKAFTRLHSRNEYEGAGIGLALCFRICEQLGGSLTAKSKLGEGSVFIASLPLNNEVMSDAG